MTSNSTGVRIKRELRDEFEILRRKGKIVTERFNVFVEDAVRSKIKSIKNIAKER